VRRRSRVKDRTADGPIAGDRRRDAMDAAFDRMEGS
jgi:hypothetical protein